MMVKLIGIPKSLTFSSTGRSRIASALFELCFDRNPSRLLGIRHLSSNTEGKASFTVAYLVNSCGLSPESALSVSKHVGFQSPKKPDSVLSLLKDHGFSQSQIASMVKAYPSLLVNSPVKNILPKLNFLLSKGLSPADIARVPTLLKRSLKGHVIPSFNFWKDLLETDEKTVTAIKRYIYPFHQDPEKKLQPKIKFLRASGVSEQNIVKFLYLYPGVFCMSLKKCGLIVDRVKEMGFNPLKSGFVEAFVAFSGMTKSTWTKKIDVFKSWGLSEEEILAAFKKMPSFMRASEEKIMAAMNLFVNELGWESSYVAKHPALVKYSFEKRLVPRAKVLQYLVQKGLIGKDRRSAKYFECPEVQFLRKCVTSHSEMPELLILYGETQNLAN